MEIAPAINKARAKLFTNAVEATTAAPSSNAASERYATKPVARPNAPKNSWYEFVPAIHRTTNRSSTNKPHKIWTVLCPLVNIAFRLAKIAARVTSPPIAITTNLGTFMGSKLVHGVIASVATIAVQLMTLPITEDSTFVLTPQGY